MRECRLPGSMPRCPAKDSRLHSHGRCHGGRAKGKFGGAFMNRSFDALLTLVEVGGARAWVLQVRQGLVAKYTTTAGRLLGGRLGERNGTGTGPWFRS